MGATTCTPMAALPTFRGRAGESAARSRAWSQCGARSIGVSRLVKLRASRDAPASWAGAPVAPRLRRRLGIRLASPIASLRRRAMRRAHHALEQPPRVLRFPREQRDGAARGRGGGVSGGREPSRVVRGPTRRRAAACGSGGSAGPTARLRRASLASAVVSGPLQLYRAALPAPAEWREASVQHRTIMCDHRRVHWTRRGHFRNSISQTSLHFLTGTCSSQQAARMLLARCLRPPACRRSWHTHQRRQDRAWPAARAARPPEKPLGRRAPPSRDGRGSPLREQAKCSHPTPCCCCIS